jgi:hypothetical protein
MLCTASWGPKLTDCGTRMSLVCRGARNCDAIMAMTPANGTSRMRMLGVRDQSANVGVPRHAVDWLGAMYEKRLRVGRSSESLTE